MITTVYYCPQNVSNIAKATVDAKLNGAFMRLVSHTTFPPKLAGLYRCFKLRPKVSQALNWKLAGLVGNLVIFIASMSNFFSWLQNTSEQL